MQELASSALELLKHSTNNSKATQERIARSETERSAGGSGVTVTRLKKKVKERRSSSESSSRSDRAVTSSGKKKVKREGGSSKPTPVTQQQTAPAQQEIVYVLGGSSLLPNNNLHIDPQLSAQYLSSIGSMPLLYPLSAPALDVKPHTGKMEASAAQQVPSRAPVVIEPKDDAAISTSAADKQAASASRSVRRDQSKGDQL